MIVATMTYGLVTLVRLDGGGGSDYGLLAGYSDANYIH